MWPWPGRQESLSLVCAVFRSSGLGVYIWDAVQAFSR